MDIIFVVVKAIIGYFILMAVGTNLIGVVVRGILPSYWKDDNGQMWRTEEIKSRQSIIITSLFIFLTVLYYYILYYYWNAGIVLAAAMLMFTSLPDIVYEMKNGEKINLKNMPKRTIDILCTIVSWLALPVIYFSLIL